MTERVERAKEESDFTELLCGCEFCTPYMPEGICAPVQPIGWCIVCGKPEKLEQLNSLGKDAKAFYIKQALNT